MNENRKQKNIKQQQKNHKIICSLIFQFENDIKEHMSTVITLQQRIRQSNYSDCPQIELTPLGQVQNIFALVSTSCDQKAKKRFHNVENPWKLLLRRLGGPSKLAIYSVER